MRNSLRFIALALVCSAEVFAQSAVASGGITGTIRDPDGDTLPDTTVVVYNEALGVFRTLATTDEGVFDAPALIPGSGYRLKITRTGFNKFETAAFEVFLGQTLNFRITMQLSPSSGNPDAVSPIPLGGGDPRGACLIWIHPFKGALLPLVDDSKTGVTELVTPRQLDTLPSSERNIDQLLTLSPGVNQNPASGAVAFRGEPFPNRFFTDGTDTSNHYYASDRAPVAPQVTQDSVAGIQVFSVAAPAEFGNAMGGLVNTMTGSGGNVLHGSAYGYWGNHAWNALDRYANGFDPRTSQHQLGATVGGPIANNKLFYFANFESLHTSSQGLNLITSPLLAPSECKASTAQCAAAASFLNAQNNVTVPWSVSGLIGLAKIDYRPNSTNTFSFEANGMHRDSPNGANAAVVALNGGLLGTNGSYNQETSFAKAAWTALPAANSVNEMRFSFYRDRNSQYTDPSLLAPDLGGAAVSVAGVNVGANSTNPTAFSERRFQITDNLTSTIANHTLRFGVEVSKTRDWLFELPNRYGAYTYPSLTAFAQDFTGNTALARSYTSFTQTMGTTDTPIRTTGIAAYAQDTWKLLPRLNITAGLRWEKTNVPQPTTTDATYYQTEKIPSPSLNFAPRISLAYLFSDRTVLRVGFGYYYQPIPGQLLDTLLAYNGYQTTISLNPNQSNAPVFPKTFNNLANIPGSSKNVVFADGKLPNPYTEQINVSLEHRLNDATSFTLNYMDTRGVHLWTAEDINLTPASTTKTYLIDDAYGTQVGTYTTQIWTARNDNNHAHVYKINNEGASRYHAFALQVRQRVTRGVTASLAYTWSHAVDDVSGAPVLGMIPTNTSPGDYRADQGDSLLDQRHRAILNWTWQPTFSQGNSAFSRYLLNGWQLSGIASVGTRLPVSALVLVNGQQFTGTTMAYTNSLNGSGGWSRVPFWAVNSLPTGPQYNVNARLSRSIPITERVSGMLMFEAYNALNTQYNTSLNTIAYTATNGVLKPVAGAGAGSASYGSPYGTNARYCQVAFRLTF